MAGYDTSFAKGRNTQLRVYELGAGATRAAPSAVTVTVGTGGASQGATTIPVTALSAAIPKYAKLTFDVGGNAVTVMLSADAAKDATELTVDPIPAGIDASDTASWDQLVRVQGGTSSSKDVNSNTSQLQSSPYEGSDAAVWDDATITSQGWQIPWQGNFKPDDPGFALVEHAAMNGREMYIEYSQPREDGSVARKLTGYVGVQNFSESAPSDGIITCSFTLIGKGAPTSTTVDAS